MNAPDTSMSRVTDWPSFFREVRACPGIWLGAVSLVALHHHVSGFLLAEELHQLPPTARFSGFVFAEFETWVHQHLNSRQLSVNSFTLARCHSLSDEAAFHLWFTWYDAFTQGLPAPALPSEPGSLPVHY